MPEVLKAESREGKTKSELHRLRAEGKIPAVVYGKKVGTASIAVEGKEFLSLLRQNRHAVLQLELPASGKHSVMIQDVQRDSLTGALLHVDLHQINMNEPVHTHMAVTLTGEPKGVQEGGMVNVKLHEIEIKCLPKDLPAAITADISGLDIGGHLLVSDIELPAKVEMLSNPDDVVVAILAPKQAEDTETAAPAATQPDAAPTPEKE